MIINIRHLYIIFNLNITNIVHNFYLSLIKNINQIYFKFKFLNFDNFFFTFLVVLPPPSKNILALYGRGGQDNENYGIYKKQTIIL